MSTELPTRAELAKLLDALRERAQWYDGGHGWLHGKSVEVIEAFIANQGAPAPLANEPQRWSTNPNAAPPPEEPPPSGYRVYEELPPLPEEPPPQLPPEQPEEWAHEPEPEPEPEPEHHAPRHKPRGRSRHR